MAKKPEGKTLADFETENLLKSQPDEVEQEEQEEEEEQENEEEAGEEEEESKEKGKKAPKKEEKKPKPTKKTKVKPEPEEEEEEEESDEAETTSEEEEEKEEESDDDDKSKEEQDFWGAVEKITGSPIEVDFGDIDPVSPQGVALREKVVAETAVNDFLDNLQEKQPKVYAAFEHAMAGGSIEDLFSPGEKDYSKVVLKDDDEDHAKLVLREYYQKRGFTQEERIKRMINADEESETGLVKSAQAALEEMKVAQEEDRREQLEEAKVRNQRQQALDKKMLEDLDRTINSLQLSSFRIPSKKEAQDFSQFVKSAIQRDGKGGYLLVTPVEPGNIEKQLQAEYFKFKNGDLDKLITTKASTKHAQALRLKIQQDSKQPKTTVKEETSQKVRSIKDFER